MKNKKDKLFVQLSITYFISLLISFLLVLVYNYHHLLSWLVHPLLSLVLIVHIIIRLVKYKTFGSARYKILSILIVVCILAIEIPKINTSEHIWSAYSDGVISGSEIIFKENSEFEYWTLTLIGNFRYYGTYVQKGNRIELSYNNAHPNLNCTTLRKEENELIFIFEPKDRNYRFYLNQ